MLITGCGGGAVVVGVMTGLLSPLMSCSKNLVVGFSISFSFKPALILLPSSLAFFTTLSDAFGRPMTLFVVMAGLTDLIFSGQPR